MTVICPDVSEFQVILTDAFGRRLLIMRASFGAHKEDRHFLANANKAADLYRRNKIDGVILYTVYLSSATPQEQYAYLWKLIGPSIPPWLIAIMLDAETWRGTTYSIHGDHSTQLNTLYGLHAHRMGSWNSCIGYGNAGDLAEIWPRRDSRCQVIVAKYSSELGYTKVRGAIGQQYTDGEDKWAVPKIGGVSLPRSSAPFGRCDHNVFPGFSSAAALRAHLRPAKPAAPKPAPKPTPKPTLVLYPAGVGNARSLVSPNRRVQFIPTDTGVIDVHVDHKHVRTI